jgi:hypothetical protein
MHVRSAAHEEVLRLVGELTTSSGAGDEVQEIRLGAAKPQV